MKKGCIHILVSGRVQGVFFRYSALRKAQQLGLVGYAKNLNDGRVEIVAEGGKANLMSLLDWAHQGPSHAYVSGVEVKWEEAKNSFPSFTIR